MGGLPTGFDPLPAPALMAPPAGPKVGTIPFIFFKKKKEKISSSLCLPFFPFDLHARIYIFSNNCGDAGGTTVQAAVYGPKAGVKENESPERACIEVVWKPKTGQMGELLCQSCPYLFACFLINCFHDLLIGGKKN